MKAIILCAGQGRRLMPLTAETPKCLLDLSGRSVLEWQLHALAAAGVEEAIVVTGFNAGKVEAALARTTAGIAVRSIHNPFYAVADNMASCWVALGEMRSPFLVLNGDTLIEPALARRVVDGPVDAPITVTIDRKEAYDDDDMKVRLDGDRLSAIGKTLEAPIDGESIGFLRFSPEGGALFADEVARSLRAEGGLKLWYLSAIDRIAKAGHPVAVRSIEGLEWGELDSADDLAFDRRMTDGWREREF
ncbi:phosphocholine cytidylyltransferase family protein [Pararhizobium mangrovi]|uniref:Phosphocholine cytidylyltransferase family protein n=1 Tax=Pararhizobium mangrovi TaxID=2590452 RepID=A0A506UAE9_9HYPH|nr:phosphocholine cytidylyltransferase family protein [Pararhizobium mangrovi]TPW29935.1 phosphocholine cytidylyltransferase family protein [Pararhizobium mangrovi]